MCWPKCGSLFASWEGKYKSLKKIKWILDMRLMSLETKPACEHIRSIGLSRPSNDNPFSKWIYKQAKKQLATLVKLWRMLLRTCWASSFELQLLRFSTFCFEYTIQGLCKVIPQLSYTKAFFGQIHVVDNDPLTWMCQVLFFCQPSVVRWEKYYFFS